MRHRWPFLLLTLAACSSSTAPSTTAVDYRVTLRLASGTTYPTFVDQTIVAVVRNPDGSFAHDVTVKWEADTGTYTAQTVTGADSATANVWSLPAPNPAPYTAQIRACATDPVSRTCTVYSGTVTIDLQ
jgi:hypothetical protein